MVNQLPQVPVGWSSLTNKSGLDNQQTCMVTMQIAFNSSYCGLHRELWTFVVQQLAVLSEILDHFQGLVGVTMVSSKLWRVLSFSGREYAPSLFSIQMLENIDPSRLMSFCAEKQITCRPSVHSKERWSSEVLYGYCDLGTNLHFLYCFKLMMC